MLSLHFQRKVVSLGARWGQLEFWCSTNGFRSKLTINYTDTYIIIKLDHRLGTRCALIVYVCEDNISVETFDP